MLWSDPLRSGVDRSVSVRVCITGEDDSTREPSDLLAIAQAFAECTSPDDCVDLSVGLTKDQDHVCLKSEQDVQALIDAAASLNGPETMLDVYFDNRIPSMFYQAIMAQLMPQFHTVRCYWKPGAFFRPVQGQLSHSRVQRVVAGDQPGTAVPPVLAAHLATLVAAGRAGSES